MSVLWLKSGYTVKYSLSPQEIPWAPPSGFPSCSGYISPYIPPLVIIQIQYLDWFKSIAWKVFLPPNWFKINLPNVGPLRTFPSPQGQKASGLLIRRSPPLSNLPAFQTFKRIQNRQLPLMIKKIKKKSCIQETTSSLSRCADSTKHRPQTHRWTLQVIDWTGQEAGWLTLSSIKIVINQKGCWF